LPQDTGKRFGLEFLVIGNDADAWAVAHDDMDYRVDVCARIRVLRERRSLPFPIAVAV
jgi:hypothetical protein